VSYRLLVLPRAQKGLAGIRGAVYSRLKEAIADLTHDPRPASVAKLSSRPCWRMRVGDYRVLYEIDDAAKTVTVFRVGHRREIYR